MRRFARTHLRSHLEKTWDTAQTQSDVALVRDQVASAASRATAMRAPIPASGAGKAAVLDAVIVNVQAAMAVDEKNPALKTLQVSPS